MAAGADSTLAAGGAGGPSVPATRSRVGRGVGRGRGGGRRRRGRRGGGDRDRGRRGGGGDGGVALRRRGQLVLVQGGDVRVLPDGDDLCVGKGQWNGRAASCPAAHLGVSGARLACTAVAPPLRNPEFQGAPTWQQVDRNVQAKRGKEEKHTQTENRQSATHVASACERDRAR